MINKIENIQVTLKTATEALEKGRVDEAMLHLQHAQRLLRDERSKNTGWENGAVDRQGGSFTQEEIDGVTTWK